MTTETMRIVERPMKALPRKFRFTVARLAAIRAPEDGRVTVYDERIPGLAYVVTSRNVRHFYFIARIFGRPNRLLLKYAITVEQARAAAMRMNGAMFSGVDPAEERRNQRRNEKAARSDTRKLERRGSTENRYEHYTPTKQN